ncbi:MAG: DUF1553 domain-containing protein [Phycisphaera sp.]|nr:DUF1553 domain-containing protein [Phycisphaera sp.]
MSNFTSYRGPWACVVAIVIGLCPIAVYAGQPTGRVDFARDVRPILSDKCFHCHGPDAEERKAKLRFDTKEGAFRDLGGYAAFVAGKPDESEAIYRITTKDAEDLMPPVKSGKKLTEAEIETVRRWVAQGAEWEDHWAFVTPTRPELPPVKDPEWANNAIDRFIEARLETEGLKPQPEADKATLIRRVTLDLTGLPPTIEEVDAFLADQRPDAYEKLVDRLLDSPRFGEHMSRYWLDAARYADTNGYQYDKERTQWAWRDWVINAYNTNMPFDQFTIEQLAGDLLPDATPAQRLATAFNRNHPITIEGGVIDEEYRTEYVIDRVVTTSTVWLGLTMLCSRCHDHKFDPISQKEFYQLFAFFNQVPERGNNGFDPRMKAPLVLQDDNADELKKRIAAAEKAYDARLADLQPEIEKWSATAQQESTWSVVRPTDVISEGGATMTILEDGSALAGGKNPAKEVYEVELHTKANDIRAIRLEALTHDSLPFNSPSRGTNGNWVLSEFTMAAQPADGSGKPTPVKFTAARADYSQNNFEIAKAIDGNQGTGWAVDGNVNRVNRTAVFVTDKPVGGDGETVLRVTMRFNYGLSHQIGRFRLSVSPDAGADFGDAIGEILATPEPKRTDEQRRRLRDYYVAQHAPADLRRMRAEIATLHKQLESASAGGPSTMVMVDKPGIRKTHVLYRGQYDQPREEVEAGTPAVFPPMPTGAPRNRLGLAQWIVDRSNPLTARVIVNRDWQRYFGTGIVKTTEDFGSQSSPPSHPELLDWLAVEFMESGWNVKALQKLIVTSAAYRQSSRVTPTLLERDPDNRLISRGPRHRLDAEMIRDEALFVSGLMIERLGGPSVYPYHPKGLWLEINNRPGYSRAYPQQTDPQQLFRRSLYTYWKRTVPPPSMATFDAPEREFCVVKRSSTNTPLQAFVLLHDPQFVEAARQLAERVMTQGGATFDDRITYAFRLVTARKPSAAERDVLAAELDRRLKQYRADRPAAEKLLNVGVSPRDARLDVVEHAAWTAVARLLLNLSETITKG